jgi:hypothetical protein
MLAANRQAPTSWWKDKIKKGKKLNQELPE